MSLILNISEIAIITGDNTFKTKRDYLIDVWKKNNEVDFENYKKITQFTKESDKDIIKKITAKNNMDFSKDLKICSQSDNTVQLNTLKRKMMDQMEKLSEDDKKELTKSIMNVTNTKFGIKNEFDITKLYEKMTGNTILKDDKYHKTKIYDIDDLKIYMGGKIDGINNENGSIIEVKNRVNKLFYALRDYEKVQITCYMFLFGTSKGQLVEAFRKKDGTDINIIDVDFDQNYMSYIFDKVIIFGKFYSNFIKNDELKKKILLCKDEIDYII
jgi:hypothetical protein